MTSSVVYRNENVEKIKPVKSCYLCKSAERNLMLDEEQREGKEEGALKLRCRSQRICSGGDT